MGEEIMGRKFSPLTLDNSSYPEIGERVEIVPT